MCHGVHANADLMMIQVAAKFVNCHDLQEVLKDGPQLLTKVVTGDESWCYNYDPEQQSRQWKSPNSPRPKEERQVRSGVKTVLIFFMSMR